jgi:hypothetical protein
MAGHLEVNKHIQHSLLGKLWEMLQIQRGEKRAINLVNLMIPFKNYKIEDLTWQRLTDRNEEGDGYVLSVYPWTFEVDDEVCEGAIAEIHLSSELTVNKIYMVM